MVLLTTQNKPNDTSNFVPVVAMVAGAIVAMSAALSTTAATPEGQDRLRAAANAVALSVAQSGQSAEQQVSTSIEIWKFLSSTTFPVHLLDGENSRLVNPIVQAQGASPSSGGYAAGATPAGVGSTDGSQIADQTPVDYSRPVVELPAPGVMNQGVEDGAKEATDSLLASALSPFKDGQAITSAGRAVTKHPEYFGFNSTQELRQIYRSDGQLNDLAEKSVQDILESGVKTTGADGRYPNGWVTYSLPDGRAVSWSASGDFIGFRGVQK